MVSNDQPYSRPFQNKVRGWIFLNGNVCREIDLIRMFKSQILRPQHSDKKINFNRKILLVTAAFDRGKEHHDRHIISMFEGMNIDADWNGEFPQNIQNLSLYTLFSQFQKREPWLYRRYTEKQEQIKAVKKDYHHKVFKYINRLNKLSKLLKSSYSDLSLFDFFHSNMIKENPELFTLNLSSKENRSKTRSLMELSCSKIHLDLCSEMRKILEHLNYLDGHIFNLCREIERYFIDKSQIRKSSLYKEQRDELVKRIRSSASIFIFGGRLFVLVNRLRFYQLESSFKQVLNKGTNIYGISAGAICQTNRFSVTFNLTGTAGDVFAADYGMGLVKGIRIFPHANDINYIMNADPDELTFFSLRHQQKVVIGLREKSVLLCEVYKDPVEKKHYHRYSSVGEHPVMVFGERGERADLEHLDEIFLEECKFYSGTVQTAKRRDILTLEKKWRKKLQQNSN